MPFPAPSRLPQAASRSISPVKKINNPLSDITDVSYNKTHGDVARGASSLNHPSTSSRAAEKTQRDLEDGDRSRGIRQSTRRLRAGSPTKIAPPKPTSAKPTSTSPQRAPSTRRTSHARPPSSHTKDDRASSTSTSRVPSGPPSSFKTPLPPSRPGQTGASSSSKQPASRRGSSTERSTTKTTSRPNSVQDQNKVSARPASASGSKPAGLLTRSQSTRVARPTSLYNPQPSELSSSPPKPTVPAKPTGLHRRNAASASAAAAAAKSPAVVPSPASGAHQPMLKRKPAFNSSNQQYSPSKPSSVPQPVVSALDFRKQQVALHMSLLHAAFAPTQEAWIASAQSQLSHRHEELVELYHQSLLLGRMARQQRNLLALTRWTGGNLASLQRKLAALCLVLDNVASLVQPSQPIHDDLGGQMRMSEEGEYVTVVEAFTEWVGYVLSIWEQRDAESADGSIATKGDFRELEGLGDAVNASIKSLMARVSALKVRMEEAGDGFPRVALPAQDGDGQQDKDEDEDVETTPAQLIRLTSALLDGMVEELQLMREIGAEAVIGEREWIEDRVRRIREDAAQGLEATPRPTHKRKGSRDVQNVFSPGWIGM